MDSMLGGGEGYVDLFVLIGLSSYDYVARDKGQRDYSLWAELAHDDFNAFTNTTFKIQPGSPRSFAVHYIPCLFGPQQGTWPAELQPSFTFLNVGSGQRSNKRKVPMTNVAAKLMDEPSA